MDLGRIVEGLQATVGKQRKADMKYEIEVF